MDDVVENDYVVLNIGVRQGEPWSRVVVVSAAAVAEGVTPVTADWSGEYDAQVVLGFVAVAEMSVTAVYDSEANETTVEVELSRDECAGLEPGFYQWAARHRESGVVRLMGTVVVTECVVPVDGEVS